MHQNQNMVLNIVEKKNYVAQILNHKKSGSADVHYGTANAIKQSSSSCFSVFLPRIVCPKNV